MELNLPLIALGLLLVGLGALVPGTQPNAVTALILTGSGLLAAGVLAPFYREFEISPTKLRFAQGTAPPPTPWMVAEADTLTNIARLTLGEAELARDAVESTLSMMRRVRRRLPAEERELLKLKALVASLDKVERKRKLTGSIKAMTLPARGVHHALQGLEFSVRVAFALRTEFPLKEVAEILGRPEGEIEARLQLADAALSCIARENQDD